MERNPPSTPGALLFAVRQFCRELPLHGANIIERGQARLVAETLNLVRGGRLREAEMLRPSPRRIRQVGIDVGAVKHVARAAGVDHALARYRKRAVGMNCTGLVIPDE